MARIPVPDVTEIPQTSVNMRPFMADPGPGNPRVGPGGSTQAKAFQTSNAANIGPPEPAGLRAPPSGTPVKDALAGAARNPSEGLRAAGEATGQAGAKYAGQAAEGLGAAGRATGRVLLGSSNSILSAAAATAGHGNAYFDKDMPLADKLRMGATDALATVGGAGGAIFGGGVGSVVPVAGTIAGAIAGGYGGERLGRKAGNFLFGGDEAQKRNGYDPERNLIDVASDGLHGKGADSFGKRSFGAGGGRGFVNPDTPGTPPSDLSGAGGGRGFVNPDTPGTPPALPDGTRGMNPNGVVTRNGNSFSGDNVKAGYNYAGAPGNAPAPLVDYNDGNGPVAQAPGATGGMPVAGSRGSGGLAGAGGIPSGGARNPIGVMPGMDMEAVNRGLASDRDLRLTKQGLADHGDGNFYTTGAGASGGAAPSSLSGSPYANPLGPRMDVTPPQSAFFQHTATARRGQDIQTAQAQADRGLRQQELAQIGGIAGMQNATTQRGQNMVMQGHVYTVDQGLRGHLAQRQFEMQKLQLEQGNKNREYEAGRGDAAFTQNQAAEKGLTEKFTAMAPTGADGKPDQSYVADQKTASQSYINGHIARLNAIPRDDPRWAQAQGTINQLRAKGPAALGDDDLQRINQSVQMRRANAEHGSIVNPFGGTAKDSTDPHDWDITGREKGLVQDQYVHRNGAKTPVGAVDRLNGGKFNLTGPQSSQYDALKTRTSQQEPGAR